MAKYDAAVKKAVEERPRVRGTRLTNGKQKIREADAYVPRVAPVEAADVIIDEEPDVIVFNDAQGRYALEDLVSGKLQVAVPPNGEGTGVTLGVAVKERPVISGFEASE